MSSRSEVEADIMPFRGIFLGLFFITVGMAIDPALLLQRPWYLLALVLGLLALSFVPFVAWNSATVRLRLRYLWLALQDQISRAGLRLRVSVDAA